MANLSVDKMHGFALDKMYGFVYTIYIQLPHRDMTDNERQARWQQFRDKLFTTTTE